MIETEKTGISKIYLSEITGRNDFSNDLPSFAGILSDVPRMNEKPVSEQDTYLDHIVAIAQRDFLRRVDSIRKIQKDKDFFSRDHSPLENQIIAHLRNDNVAVRQIILKDSGDYSGYFKFEKGQPLISYNGIEALIHETEHYLQLIDGDGHCTHKRSKIGEIAELYAKLASLHCILKYGSGPRMWPVYQNFSESPEESLLYFIGGLEEFFDYGIYTEQHPFYLEAVSFDKAD